MADKPKLNVFSKTEATTPQGQPIDLTDLDKGNIQQTGVGLREGEMLALSQIGDELGGVARNALIRYAVRMLIHEYRAGRLDLAGEVETPPPPKKRLKQFGSKK